MHYDAYEEGEIVEHQPKKAGKQNNILPFHGNEASMNLNPLILTNIQSSSYFKVNLFKLKTYHEVVDEIYYQVKHLEPWERGSRKNPGVGMCGSVRGVGAGGIVSSAYCLLFKLYTLKLTRKQVNGLINHTDSPYIRGLGFMYIRYTQPPGDLFDWYEDYLQDEEEIDVKAGGGHMITIGQMVRQFLVKLDWFSTLFPRIPVPIQKQIQNRLAEYSREHKVDFDDRGGGPSQAGASREHRERSEPRRRPEPSRSRSHQEPPPRSNRSRSPRRYDERPPPPRRISRSRSRSPRRHKKRDRYDPPDRAERYERREPSYERAERYERREPSFDRSREDKHSRRERSQEKEKERHRDKHKKKKKHKKNKSRERSRERDSSYERRHR